jgi:hypothetical protein
MFTFRDCDLWPCPLEWGLTVPVEAEGQGERIATVHCALRLGYPVETEDLTVALRLDGREYRAIHPDFEDTLHEIGAALPPRARLKACIRPHGILTIWPLHTEFVQETWLCEQFEHRTSDRGYRGLFPFRGWD